MKIFYISLLVVYSKQESMLQNIFGGNPHKISVTLKAKCRETVPSIFFKYTHVYTYLPNMEARFKTLKYLKCCKLADKKKNVCLKHVRNCI